MKPNDYIQRQGLLSLLVAQVAVVALHWQRLPLWTLLLTLLVLVWRIQVYRNIWSFPNKSLRLLLLVASVGAIVAWYQQWYALEPMVVLLTVAFLLKLLEVNKIRDALVLIYVGFFVSACAFLFDQGIVTTLAGIAALWLLTHSLLVLQNRHLTYFSRRGVKTIAALLLQAVPLMVLMLLVFPRIGALWAVPLQNNSALTGISDSMTPGDFSQLSRSRKLAFRVNFYGDTIPEPAERYWRGLVLTDFDGRRWERRTAFAARSDPSKEVVTDAGGADYKYDIFLEPANARWLYAMPVATVQGAEARRTTTDELLLLEPATQRIKYQVTSTVTRRTEASQEALRDALLLPRGFNPQTRARARQWRGEVTSDSDYIRRVLQFYREQFFYTLSPPALGLNSVDEFLFTTQRGFCEHFASSFVVLMRAVGIPARVVAGYQGGEWNALEGYLTVRQYDAHAWTEVWLAERGWVRIDPTAAVAPDRIEQGLLESLTQADQGLVETRMLATFSWVNNLLLQWDGINYRWQQWVLSYDEDTQSQLLQDLLGRVTPARLALLLVVPGVLLLTVFGFLTLRTRGRPRPESIRLYHLLVKQLNRRDVACNPDDTLNRLRDKALKQLPAKATAIQAIVQQLNTILYSNEQEISKKHYRSLKARIKSL